MSEKRRTKRIPTALHTAALFGLAMGCLGFSAVGSTRAALTYYSETYTAQIDVQSIGVSLLGLIIFSGFNFTSLKMLLVVVFLWFASPVSSHLIAKLEVVTDEDLEQHCEVKR